MHGRLKVKTTEEQQEAKRKEREEKLKRYRAATAIVFDKREKREYESELLLASSEILAANPDFYTLWNIRREAFLESASTLQEQLTNELSFLEQCLRVNPKSYGTWQHRCWVLDNMPEPDWKRELLLCNKFLEYDERNFHCWDYRRFVVQRSGVSAGDELDFTTNKIEANFSNYSSWHYRSKLLVKVHPGPGGSVTADQLVSECLLAQNAFFTDPNDQSAWFYHRWLLGRVEPVLRVEAAYIDRQQLKLIVVLSRDIKLDGDQNIEVRDEAGTTLSTNFKSPRGAFSTVWFADGVSDLPAGGLTVSITLSGDVQSQQEVPSGVVSWRRPYASGTKFTDELAAVTKETLTQELDSLQQLHDLEPDNKWVLLTLVSVMRALDPLGFEKQTFEYIDKLVSVDEMRSAYYRDLRSKFVVENSIDTGTDKMDSVDLSGRGLTTFAHYMHFAVTETLQLSDNKLTGLPDACLLQALKTLDLDNNALRNCDNFCGLGSLEHLSLRGNRIKNLADLSDLKSCKNLKKLCLTGNPVCGVGQAAISETLPGLEIVCE